MLLKLIFKVIKLKHVLLLEKGVSANLQVSKYFLFSFSGPNQRGLQGHTISQFGLKHCCSLESNDNNIDDDNNDENNSHNDNFLGWNVGSDKVIIRLVIP